MEPAAAWEPCEFQLANWAVEDEPAAGLPVEYASIDIFDTCSLQAYVPEEKHSGGQQQLVEHYYYSAASERNATREEKAKISNDSQARTVVEQVMEEFKDDIDVTKKKIHRYPACLGPIDEHYTVPRIVAIGPYHHLRDHLKQAEKVKHAAACHCVRQSGLTLEELYGAVVQAADRVRHLYDKDVLAGIGSDDFRHMMFFDACFLVQYMLMVGDTNYKDIDASLLSFLRPIRDDIFHDVMLLENQLPWGVLEAVMKLMPMSPPALIWKKFVHNTKRCMQPDREDKDTQTKQTKHVSLEKERKYTPPHLLGLLRYYIVGKRTIKYDPEGKLMSFSLSAMELAEIGITVTANKTMKLIDMDLDQEGALFAELILAPLSLDRDRASYLVNMAAHELCTVASFSHAEPRDSAVVSYLQLMAMLVSREEDVHELRVRDLLRGGQGLTNEEALRFFSIFQRLRRGPYYNYVMREIERYRENRRIQTKLYAFYRNNKKTIAAVVSGIGAVGGIIGTLLSIKKGL